MSVKDSNTENLIKNTAMRIFFAEGRFQATTQEIADAAGVNRTLVHYYFRSRDLLFKQVLEEGRTEFHKKMDELVRPEQSFREKINHLIDIWMEHGKQYSFLDTYLVSQLNNPDALEELIEGHTSPNNKLLNFYDDIEKEMQLGNIVRMAPVHFLVNLVAMVAYPTIMKPLLMRALEVSTADFEKLMAERKEAILKTLFLK